MERGASNKHWNGGPYLHMGWGVFFFFLFFFIFIFFKKKKKIWVIEFVKLSQPKGEILLQYVGWRSTPFGTCLYLLITYYLNLQFFVHYKWEFSCLFSICLEVINGNCLLKTPIYIVLHVFFFILIIGVQYWCPFWLCSSKYTTSILVVRAFDVIHIWLHAYIHIERIYIYMYKKMDIYLK